MDKKKSKIEMNKIFGRNSCKQKISYLAEKYPLVTQVRLVLFLSFLG